MITKLTTTDFTSSTLSTISGPTITSIQITDSSYNPLDDTAISTSGGYISINGTGFVSGCQVYIDSTISTTVTFVSSIKVNVQVPAASAGTYVIYLLNPNGSMAIRINGLTYSSFPAWGTGAALSDITANAQFTVNFSATSDSSVVYSLATGSLPPGSTLYANGVFTGNVTTVSLSTTYSFTVDAIDVEYQNTSRTFSVTVVVSDPFFRNTTLLINSDISGNVWTYDASTNNVALTISEAKPNPLSPYLTSWGTFFNGSSDYFTWSGSTVPGAFTFECWFYYTGTFASIAAFCGPGAATNNALNLYINNSTTLTFDQYGVTATNFTVPTMTSNQWYHVAFVRNSSNLATVFLNGTRSSTGTASISTSFLSIAAIGYVSSAVPRYFQGFLSNVRYVTNAVYDPTQSTITVPTSALTAISGTQLLTCQSNRLIDNSSNAYTLTPVSTVFVKATSPFTETNLTTGSGLFDGNGDYLTLSGTTVGVFNTSDFTIEMWVYPLTVSAVGYLYDSRTVNTNPGIQFYIDASARLGVGVGTTNVILTAAAMTINQWQHVAVVKQSGTWSIFRNGVSLATGTNATSITDTALVIGTSFNNQAATTTDKYNGYISNIRVVNGVGVYNINFTLPTAAFPTSGSTDSYFNLVTLLLNTSSTNGAQNNAFLDSSTNNFSITPNGNVTQGTFTPFSQTGWSNYFNGSTPDYLGFSTLTLGSSFTVEFFVYFPSTVTTNTIVISNAAGVGDNWIGFDSTTAILSYGGFNRTFPYTVTPNTWVYVQIINSSSSLTCYVNGDQKGTSQTGPSTFALNRIVGYSLNQLTGYLSNIRITNAALTPGSTPTTPLTTSVSSGTVQLLTCQSNRFVDNSASPFTLTTTGTPSVQTFSPFAPTAAYSTTTVGGSGYFDGTGDYLTVADNAALEPGSGTFTAECWIYPTALPPTYGAAVICKSATTSYGPFLIIIDPTTRYIYAYCSTTASSWDIGLTSTVFASLNTWYHVALVRSGSSFALFINGTRAATATSSGTLVNNTDSFAVGYANYTSTFFNGYISSVRYVVGTAVYNPASTTYTIPTAPANPSGSTLCINYTNAGIFDSTAKNVLETVGNAQVSTAQAKFGTTSIAFDGNGDYLICNQSPSLMAFGSGDFTIECWVYFNTIASQIVYDGRPSSVQTTQPTIYMTGAGVLQYYANNSNVITGPTLSASTWYHIAVCRASSQTKMFLNGVQAGSTYADTTVYTNTTGRPLIGIDGFNLGNPLNGYIDDLRVTKGYARYTGVYFIPPTSQLATSQAAGTSGNINTNQVLTANTRLLTLQNRQPNNNFAFVESSLGNYPLSRTGTPNQGSFSPFSQTGWSINVSNTNYYQFNNTTITSGLVNWGSGGLTTLECWIYPTTLAASTNYNLIGNMPGVVADNRWFTYVSGTATAGVANLGFQYTTSNSAAAAVAMTTNNLLINTWNHVVLQTTNISNLAAAIITLFCNGISQQFTVNLSNLNVGNSYTPIYVGYAGYIGYISNLRFAKSAIYNAASALYDIPTSPLTTTSQGATNVFFLGAQNGYLKDNGSQNLPLVVASVTPSIQAFSPFAPTSGYTTSVVGGSGYFSAANNFISTPSLSSLFSPGNTGAWTLEGWFYPISSGAYYAAGNGGSFGNALYITWNGSQFSFLQGNGGSNPVNITSGANFPAYTWHHVAVVKNASNLITLYLNGRQVGTPATYTASIASGAYHFVNGSYDNNGFGNGGGTFYGSNIRWILGTAVYSGTSTTTENFVVPTAPFTASMSANPYGGSNTAAANATLLYNFNNAAIIDSTSKNTLQTIADSTVSIGQSKFGGSSMFFDGTGDYLILPYGNQILEFGSGSYTVEFWLYAQATTGSSTVIGKGNPTSLSAEMWSIEFQSNQLQHYVCAYSSASPICAATGITWVNTWHHVAVVRNGNTWTMYVDGIAQATTTTGSYTITQTAASNPSYVGTGAYSTGRTFTGYIDDLRVTKGIARYTANFSVPTSPFPLR